MISDPIERVLYREVPGLTPSRLRLALCSLWSYRKRLGAWPNIIRPKTFHELLQQKKILDTNPLIPLLADKLRVKDYVRERLGPGWIIPTLWSGKELPRLQDRAWAVPYVIKANHGSGWNHFILTPDEVDWPAIEFDCKQWMASFFGTRTGEWHYTRIDPMLLVEPFIGTAGAKPIDYKLFVFHGRVAFTQVVTERDATMRLTMYDRQWRRYHADDSGHPVEDRVSKMPDSFEAMVNAAEKLARGLDFVRVDFYEINSQPIFGEMTFYPGAGQDPFNPPAFDKMVFDLLKRA